jgi:hypothetical protein
MTRTMTMDEKDYNELRDQIDAANKATAAVRAELEAERARPVDVRLSEAHIFIDAAKDVVDYAVGNLNPEFSRGWPVEAITILAEKVAVVGAVTARDQARAQIWKGFTDSVVDFDKRWALATMAKSKLSNAEILATAEALREEALAEEKLAEARTAMKRPEPEPSTKALFSTPTLIALFGGAICLILATIVVMLLIAR